MEEVLHDLGRWFVYQFDFHRVGKFEVVCKQADIYFIFAMYLYLKQDFIVVIQTISAPRSPSHHHQATQ